MIPGMNPKQMQRAMKQMGIKQEEIPATRVEIFLEDKKLVFSDPEVSKINMMGQETYQLLGTPNIEHIDTKPSIAEEDVQTVVDQTGVTSEEARKAIEKANGDLAEAILTLQNTN